MSETPRPYRTPLSWALAGLNALLFAYFFSKTYSGPNSFWIGLAVAAGFMAAVEWIAAPLFAPLGRWMEKREVATQLVVGLCIALGLAWLSFQPR